MSVSLREVIEAGGYNLDTAEGCRWLLSREEEFEDLKELAYYMIEQEENAEYDYIDGLEDNNAEIERDLAQRAEMGGIMAITARDYKELRIKFKKKKREFERLYDLWLDEKLDSTEQFYFEDLTIGGEKQFVAVDNMSGGFYIEDFDTEDKAILWLLTEISTEDLSKLEKQDIKTILENNLEEEI